MRTDTMRHRTPQAEAFYRSLGSYLTAESTLREIRVAIHADTLNYFPNGFDAENETEEEAYITLLGEVEKNYPLEEAVRSFQTAEETLITCFLDLMEEEADRRQQVHLRNLRNGTQFVGIRKRIIGLAQKYVERV